MDTPGTIGRSTTKCCMNNPGTTESTTGRLQEVHEKFDFSEDYQETLQECREAPEMWSWRRDKEQNNSKQWDVIWKVLYLTTNQPFTKTSWTRLAFQSLLLSFLDFTCSFLSKILCSLVPQCHGCQWLRHTHSEVLCTTGYVWWSSSSTQTSELLGHRWEKDKWWRTFSKLCLIHHLRSNAAEVTR